MNKEEDKYKIVVDYKRKNKILQVKILECANKHCYNYGKIECNKDCDLYLKNGKYHEIVCLEGEWFNMIEYDSNDEFCNKCKKKLIDECNCEPLYWCRWCYGDYSYPY